VTFPVFFKFCEINLPDKKLRRVVLPAPDAPIMLKNCPGKTVPETLFKMTLGSASFGFFPQHPAFGRALMLMFDQLS